MAIGRDKRGEDMSDRGISSVALAEGVKGGEGGGEDRLLARFDRVRIDGELMNWAIRVMSVVDGVESCERARISIKIRGVY